MMASIVYFKKLDEDDEYVWSEFGRDKENITRELVLDKGERRSHPVDDKPDSEFLEAAVKIHRMSREEGVWPRIGAFVS